MGPVLNLQVEFIIRTADKMTLGIDKNTERSPQIGGYNVPFLLMEDVLNHPRN